MSIQHDLPAGWKEAVAEFTCWTAGLPGVELRYQRGILHISVASPAGDRQEVADLVSKTTDRLLHTCELCGDDGVFGAYGPAYRCFGVRCDAHRELAPFHRKLIEQLKADEAAQRA